MSAGSDGPETGNPACSRGGTEVRVRTVSVQAGKPVSLETRPNSKEIRSDDGVIRWLTVEAATRSELEEFFNRLGCDGKVVSDHIAGEQWTLWLDRKQFCIMGHSGWTESSFA